MLESLKYFSFIMIVAKEQGVVRILYSCLANRAKLQHSKSLKPIPPSDLEWLNLDQLIYCSLLDWEDKPHRNFANKNEIFLQSPLRSLKTLIV